MNIAEDLGELELEVEELPEVKEKTISARLILSDEQVRIRDTFILKVFLQKNIA